MRALHEYFEAHAASSPHRVAITSSGGALSYGELNRRANQLAHALRTRGVDADVLVGLCLATGPDLIVGMLAILKAGGGYLPLDPQQPAERLAQILSGAKPALVLTNGAAADLATDGLPTLCMTEQSEFIDAQSDTNPGMSIAAEQLCYVMFTSGSTGAPKGVMVTHGNLEFLFAGVDGAEHYGLGIGPSDVWTLFHTFSFGFSVWEIWGALRHGARLVIVAPELRADPDGLFDLLRAESVTIISQTPSAFRQNFLPDHFRHQLAPLSLRAIVLSGEAVAAEDLQCWFLQHGDDGPRLINTYAITETAGQVTVREYTAEESRGALAKSIGQPLSHTRVFILDAEQKPVSAGIVGELYVGGPGVARGYINDSRHTAERFVDLDIDGSGSQRLYRTGDQASWSANAGLQFLGRTDEQVKLRGYRIELGEVETALRGHPLVRDAAVAIQEDDHGQAKLAGYLVSAVSSVPAIAKDSESPEFWPSVGPYQLYDEFLYDLMSSEAERIERYRHAFEHSVRDKIVLDIGTGEHALLARMCLEAGARRVYAVEVLNDAYTKARELIERQGLDECIKVIHGDVASVELPDKVDVCTQGIIGNVGSADGIVSIWNSARRFFKSGCIPIPARCQTMIAAVELPDVLRDKPTFNSLAKSYAEKAFVKLGRRFDIRLCVRNFPATGIISDTHLFEDLDFSGPLNAALNGKAVFTIERDARLDGFLVWTVVTTSGTASVDYLQNQQAWLPVFLPCPDDGVSIRCGDRIAAEWSSRHSSGVNPDYRISAWVESDDQSSRGFQYESCYAETAYNSTAVHRSLWRNSSASESGASHASIKAWLAERLPDYMVPSVWVSLPELPLNANGKLDRSALPLPTRSRPELDMPFEAPRGKLQIDLAGLWSEILAIDQIGVHDNFFDLGGDSIAAVRLTSAMQRLLDDAVMLVAIFDAPTIDGLARYLSEHHEHAVTTRYDGILAESEAGRTQTDPGQASAPLSYPQQSFWLLQQLYPDQTGANEQFVITLDGTLDVDSLGLAWNAVIQRHEILRTTFHEEDGDAIQFVKAHSPTPLSIIDCRGLLSRSAESRFFAAAQEAIEKPFDLANGPLINACLFRFSERENRLLVNAHHIIADGLSLHVIKRELASLYALAVRDRPLELVTPEMQYRDFAVSQRIRLKDDRLQTCLEYWRRVLSDAPETLALPEKMLTRRSAHQQRLGFEIDPVIADGMRQLSRRENATVFMGLLAAFRTLLFRYSDQVDISIGSPMTCRNSDAMNAMVGCLVNNVVFRTSTDGDPAFVDLLRRERDTALAAFQHSDAPFEKVVEAVRPRRQVGRHPLFQTLFLFENNRSPLAHGGAVAFGVETLETERCSYWDLEFSVTDDGDGRSIRGFLGYRTDVFERSFAEALPVHFKQLLRAIVAHPDAPISRLDLLPAVERRRLLSDWNRTRQEYPAQDTLHALFEARVRSHPSEIAVIDDAGQLTYAELNRRANHLARSLRDAGLGGGALVGIGVRRSAEMVTAVLATLKIGAAYLPLDPDYPRARLEYMMRDAGVRAICIDRKFPELTGLGTIDQIRIDSLDWQSIDNDIGATANIDVVVAPDAPAYVLYTSGSTGRPKGAVGLHRGAVNRCHWMWREYGFGSTDVFSLRTSLNFVDSVWEIFGALLHGAPVAIIADDAARDPRRLIETLDQHAVNHIVLVPSLLQALLEAEPCLGQRLPLIHTWLSSGEPLTAELLEAFRAAVPGARLLNTYGTSEIWDAACFDVSGWEISQPVVPIGKPIANVQTYILDKNMQPVPPGVTGELYVGGVGLGPGYWRRPELTAERFVPNPFAANRGTRLYRTGDLAKYLPHGDIQCLGRIDQQIKLRGFRVEPGEIETALSSHADVRRTVVDLRETRSGEPALIAYCVSAESCFNRDALYRHLQQQLPEHMIPARFVRMDELPLTPSGKIDRLSLPAPDWSEAAGKSFIPPGTLTEQTIAGLWKEVLGTARVGLQDDFFEQGGHSLSATRLLARIRATFGVDLSLRELFDEPTVFAVATRVDFLLADRNAAAPATAKAGKEIQRVPRTEGELPLSFGQERLWFLDQLEPSSPAYNIAFTLELSGDLKVDALQSALDHLVTRHEALRTCFPSSGGRAVQKVLSALSIPLQREDLIAHGDDDLQESLAALARRPFNLVTGPLLRTHLIRLTAVDHILLIVIHHIVSDGVSNAILFEELAELYAAIAAGSAPPLPALPFQYVDYAGWQRQNQARWQAQLDYWTEQLRNAPAAVEIPTDRPRPPEQRFRGSWLWRELSADTANALRALGREHRCTLFMVMLGVFDVLLHRYSGQQDIVVGTPIAGRARAEFEGLIGLFINTVALRADLAANPTFSEFLAQLRQVTLDAQANQALPFERLVEALQPDRTLSHAPVFQVMFNLTPIPQRNRDSVGLAMTMGRLLDHGVSTFDLTLSVGERTDGLDLVFEYDRDLFDRETIDRMAAHYTQLLSAVLVKTDRRIRELPILEESEVQQLSETWSSGRAHSPDDEVFAAGAQAALHLFEARADLSPDAVAVISGARHMCYGELEARANRLAHHLQTLGVGPETRVALCLDKSELILLAILGTHKAGGAYVPVDPDYPSLRLTEMLSRIEPAVVITDSIVAASLPRREGPLIVLDRDEETFAHLPSTRLSTIVEDHQLAYVLYTSGSTGQAKGAMVTHRNLLGAYRAWEDAYGLTAADRHLQMASFSFDVFTGDWVRALCSGGSLVLCPRMVLLEPSRLYALMREAQITCAEFVPAVMRLLSNYLRDKSQDLSFMRLIAVGSDIWFGGEYVALKQLCGDRTRLINSYGTAEATIDSTYFEVTDNNRPELRHDAPVPIGRPLPDARVYILDDQLQLVPIGVAGELCIGGSGVARGYLNDAASTAERFLPDPFVPDGRLFRTGDRARYRADGTIELLGRTDQQVKLRGFRIELGEIEGVLAEHSAVAASAVILSGRETASESLDGQLIAYVVPNGGVIEVDALRRYLKRRLPDYMVPAVFVQRADLPLTANGKLDRLNLPSVGRQSLDEAQQVPPRTPVEAAICSLFAEVLGIESVGIHDNFFDLGGHSLLATQLVSRIRDALNVELALLTLFESSTPAELAGSMRQIQPGSVVPLRVSTRANAANVPASYAQQRLWFLSQLEPENTAYHLHWTGRLTGRLDKRALSSAVDALIARHAILRTTFSDSDGMPIQHVAEKMQVPVVFATRQGCDKEFVQQWVGALLSDRFDLCTGPLLRAHVLQVAEREHVLLLVMHHIISDGWSMSVLFRELATAYNALRRNASPDWPRLPVQYADYAIWQRDSLAGAELVRQIDYWRAQLADSPASLALPIDRARPPVQSHRGAWLGRQLSADLSGLLHELGRNEGATLFMVLLAAFDVVLGHYAGQQEVLVGTPIAGRNRTELEGLIGFFVNTLVLRTDLSGNPSFRELLARVKQTALAAYANQDLPFEKLVEVLSPARNPSLNPIVQTLFTVHNQPVHSLLLDGVQVQTEQISHEAAKFDLSLHVAEQDGRLNLAFAYNADLFDAETIEGLAGYYAAVLASVVRLPGQRIAALAGLASSRAVPGRGVAAVAARPLHGTLTDAFVARVSADAKRLAVHTALHRWSYGVLNERANQVAHGLRVVLPAGSDEFSPRVGLMCAQDAPLLAGLLGILKAGAAYVPLDPGDPPARLQAVVADAGIEVVVADAAHAGAAQQLAPGAVLDIEALAGLPVSEPRVALDGGALAYIIYTSGTTGRPKGVMQTHQGVLQQITRYSSSLGLCAEDRLSLLSGYGFDAAVQDIFGALLNGAALYPLAMRELISAAVRSSELVDELVAAQITVLHATPTVYRYLLGGELSCAHDLSCIRRVVLGGEAVRRADFEIFKARFARGTQFVNGLGLTESTLALQYVADHETRLLGQVVPVGEAVGGVEVELLDESGEPSWYGEITLTGQGISPGYWRQDELNRRCFAPHARGTVYRTGDIGRRLPDGQIAYVGRRDAQVKIRGYRVELGEIESLLAAHPQVAACAAALVEGPGDARLVAYLVAAAAQRLQIDELRAYLAARLPGYMLPQAYEVLSDLPLLANGKVARAQLPVPLWGRDAEQVFVPPRTELEDALTNIWLDVLQLDEVGVHDDFFALGGHSLLATRLISRVRDHLDLEVPLRILFENSSIRSMAAGIEATKEKDFLPPIVTISRVDRRVVDTSGDGVNQD